MSLPSFSLPFLLYSFRTFRTLLEHGTSLCCPVQAAAPIQQLNCCLSASQFKTSFYTQLTPSLTKNNSRHSNCYFWCFQVVAASGRSPRLTELKNRHRPVTTAVTPDGSSWLTVWRMMASSVKTQQQQHSRIIWKFP